MMEIGSQSEAATEKPDRSYCIEDDSDADLVAWMTLRDEDEEAAFRACEILFKRHSPVLLGWCQQRMGNIFGDTAEGFVNAAFKKAFDHAEKFQCPTRAVPDEQRRRVVGWLFQILKNLIRDSFKAEARERRFRERRVEAIDTNLVEFVESPQDNDTCGDAGLSDRGLLVRRFLEEELSDEDAEFLQLSANFFDFARNEPVIDPDLLEGVCQRMGVTPSGLRSRRRRILVRLRLYIEQHEMSD
jgi:DNA-directed RNA polymerase specialized sigma24 family protein